MNISKKQILTLIGILFFNLSFAQEINDSTTTEPVSEESSIFDKPINWYMNNLNYGTITLFMSIESSFIPFPSEVIVPPAAYKAGKGELNLVLVIVFATLGAILGALINYYISISLGRSIIYKLADSRIAHLCLINREKIEKAEQYFIKNGKSSTLIGRLIPGIRQLISIPAGIAKMPIGPFILYTGIGALIWNIILAILGYFLYSQKELLNQYYHELSIALLILGGLFIIYLIYKGLKK